MTREEIKKGLFSYLDSIKWGVGEYHEVFGSLINMLSLPEKDEWIPTIERLPEDQQNILFSTKTDRVFEGRYFDDNTGQQWYAFRDDCFAWNNVVTAWQPLPEPYKAEKGGE